MSKTSPFKVFSGTNSKYLAEKNLQQPRLRTGKHEYYTPLLMVNLLFPSKSQLEVPMYS